MLPINVDAQLAATLAADFDCQLATFPFAYLGLPLGTTRPKLADLTPIVTGLERRLACTSSFLPRGARLQLVTSALASMPIFWLCSLQLPPGIIKQLDRILRQCVWREDKDVHKQSLAAWEMLIKPKKKGGGRDC